MKLWAYYTAEGEVILIYASSRQVALRKLNLMLKHSISPEDRALVEIPRTWMARILDVHEDAVADTMAAEEVPTMSEGGAIRNYAARLANRWLRKRAGMYDKFIGEKVYLTPEQCDLFGCKYDRRGDETWIAASTLLRSADYDVKHQRILRPLGSRTLSRRNVGHGWYEIVSVL